MLNKGAILEVKKFLRLSVGNDHSARKAIGVSEIGDFLEEKYDLNETFQKISIKTRQYAKRQTTWARGHMMNWNKVQPKDLTKFLKKFK